MHGRTRPLWLGEIRPGMRLALPAFDCSAELVAGYAELLDARHPVHVDAEYAKTTRYGRLIAHGPLVIAKVLAMLGGVFGEALQVLLGVGAWRFYGPVFVGDRVAVECTVLDVDAAKGASAGSVEIEFRVLAADGSLAQRGTASVLISRAAAASA
ncbi:MAG: MaoC family dehydratase N-terminal domain-containing protein [Burkholderiales bacterium]|nr:MaoC family dehydratase N-terminal domain-containing protein [Burkholderiales bacterium]